LAMEVYAEGAHIRQERVCPDCRGRDFVEDHAAGDIVCRVRALGLAACPHPLCMQLLEAPELCLLPDTPAIARIANRWFFLKALCTRPL
jgi:hypothetical protein